MTFKAIPHDVGWNDAAELARLLDGYRLLDLVGEEKPDAFLYRQRDTGKWPNDAVKLWIRLFLEVRADHIGANDAGGRPARLDFLCRQLRKGVLSV